MLLSALSPTSPPTTVLLFFTGFKARLLKTVVCTHCSSLLHLLYFSSPLIWFSLHSTKMYLLNAPNYICVANPKGICFYPHLFGLLSPIWSGWALAPTWNTLFFISADVLSVHPGLRTSVYSISRPVAFKNVVSRPTALASPVRLLEMWILKTFLDLFKSALASGPSDLCLNSPGNSDPSSSLKTSAQANPSTHINSVSHWLLGAHH